MIVKQLDARAWHQFYLDEVNKRDLTISERTQLLVGLQKLSPSNYLTRLDDTGNNGRIKHAFAKKISKKIYK